MGVKSVDIFHLRLFFMPIWGSFSIEINRKGQNFGFGRKNDPKKLQKVFRLFRQKDRKNRKSQFWQKEGYFGRKTQFCPKPNVTATWKMGRKGPLSAEISIFWQKVALSAETDLFSAENPLLKFLSFGFGRKSFGWSLLFQTFLSLQYRIYTSYRL